MSTPRDDGTSPAVRHAVSVCPRCTYQGQGMPYFSKGTHVAGLVGATVLTAAAMGVGGLGYYLARHSHRVCPRCGEGWGRNGERVAVQPYGAPSSYVAEVPSRREGFKQAGSVLLFVLAAFLLLAGFTGGEFAVAGTGVAAGAGGWFLRSAARRAREARRAELLTALQRPVLKLAADRRGRLTVTEVATALGWTMQRSEKVLHSLDDGLRVSSEVTDEGVIVYEFRELRSLPAPPRELNPDADRL